MSHELYEIYTDPIFGTSGGNFTGLGWWDESNSAWTLSPSGARTRELADLCVNRYYGVPGTPEPTGTLNGATLQQLWSQKACKCQ